jgi:hypothetical protein
MKEKLAVVLEQLKTAKIQVSQRTLRKQVNLFEYDDSPDIEFNGHRSLPSLQEHLFTFYTPIKQQVDAMVQSADMQPHSLKKDFDLACFEIREFRKRYFPKDNYDVLFHRVELHKSTPLELKKDEGIKKILNYFDIQYKLLEILEELFRHRILHISKFCLTNILPVIHDPDLPTKQEISAYLSGQLSLFPKGSGLTLIQWKQEKVEFIELFIAVYESNAIKSTTKNKITRKEFFGLLMWFFNIQIGNLDSSLTATKNRKIEHRPYLKELLDAFESYCNRKS